MRDQDSWNSQENGVEPDYSGYYAAEKRKKKHTGLLVVLTLLALLTGAASWAVNVLGVQVDVGQGGLVVAIGRTVQDTEAEPPVQEAAENTSMMETEPPAVQTPEETLDPVQPTETGPDLNTQPSPASVENRPSDAENALSLQEIYEKVIPSVASISCVLPNGTASGTGIVMSADGYIITNYHVIEDAQFINVLLEDDVSYQAALVGGDETSDLAVLKVEATDLTAAEFGDSDALRVGDMVVAIGDPLGAELRGTMTDGIVSAINRDLSLNGRQMTLIQTNAALNSGNSGGPLINCYGQVIGINTMKMSNSIADAEAATVEGLGFAVPTGRAVTVINDILATGAFHGIPSIGVYVAEEQQPDGTYRPVIDSVTENFGAEAAGLQRGDVILSADGTAVYSNYDLLRARRAHIVGETITLTVQRDGQTLDVEVYLYPVIEE